MSIPPIITKYILDNKLKGLTKTEILDKTFNLTDPIAYNIRSYFENTPYCFRNYLLQERSEEIKRLLAIRKEKKLAKPSFKRYESKHIKRIGTAWRRPRGIHNKRRKGIAAKGKSPKIGYGVPRAVKGFNSKGYPYVLVHNIAQVDTVIPQKQMLLVAKVGMKQKIKIQNLAYEKKLVIMNPLNWSYLLECRD